MSVPLTEQADEVLLAETLREGSDGPAFRALLARHREGVWRLCFRLMGNEHDAADAAQEVFVRLFLQRGKFQGRSQFRTWLYAIAVRTCLELRRGRGRRQKRETLLPEQPEQTQTPPTAGLAMDLMQMLETLDEDDRALVILKYAEGYRHEELCEIFNLTPSACKMRISRARQRLRERFPEMAH